MVRNATLTMPNVLKQTHSKGRRRWPRVREPPSRVKIAYQLMRGANVDCFLVKPAPESTRPIRLANGDSLDPYLEGVIENSGGRTRKSTDARKGEGVFTLAEKAPNKPPRKRTCWLHKARGAMADSHWHTPNLPTECLHPLLGSWF
jgi:hypothetical protein